MPETIITIGILAAMFAWPFLLQIICPACSRILRGYRSPAADHEDLDREDASGVVTKR